MAEDGIVEVPVDDIVEVPVDEPKRPSNPFKQAVAGLSDIATGIPSILGLAGGGLQAGFNTIFDEGSLKENFIKAISDKGVDQTLLDAGLGGRHWVNEALGIAEPKSIEDQAARLGASLIPIPGLTVAANAGRLAKLAAGTANVLTPAVKLGAKGRRFDKGFKTRAGIQLGIGTGIDQGIRAVLDDPELPTIFSDEAIFGSSGEDPLTATSEGGLSRTVGSGFQIDGGAGDDVLLGGTGDDLLGADTDIVEVDPFEDIVEIEIGGPLDTINNKEDFADRRELDLKVEKQDDWEDIKFWALTAAAASGAYAAAKFAQSHALKKAVATAPFGLPAPEQGKLGKFITDLDPANVVNDAAYLSKYPGVLNQGQKDARKFIGEAFVDRSKALYNGMIAQGHSREAAEGVVSTSHIDTIGMSQTVHDTGEFGQGFQGGALGEGITHAVRDLELEHVALGADRMKIFNEGMIAQTTKITRGLDDKSNLWGIDKSNKELDQIIQTALKDEDVSNLMKKFSEFFDDHLEYQKFRGLITDDEVKAFRGKFTTPAGRLAYMPLYSANRRTFGQRLARKFGIHTDKAKELDIMGEFHTRGPDGVAKPLGPMEALTQYNIHSIDQANRSAFHYQALSHLAGIQFNSGKIARFALDKDGNIIKPLSVRRDQTARGTSYIGRGTIDDQTDAVKIKLDKDYKGDVREGTVNDIRVQMSEREIVTIQRDGELLAFHVPDKGIRGGLDMNPQLGAGLHFMNHYKTLFTRFTTGDLSLFAPISFAFQSQQVALATSARQGLGQGFKSVGRSLGGAKELLIVNSAKEIAQFLSHRIATNTGIGKFAPQASLRLRDAFEKRFRNAMLNDIRGETGRIGSSLQADTFTGSVADFANSVGRNFGQKYGADQAGLVWRLWKGWNNALHEGPAYGAMMKRIGEARLAGKEIDGKVLREAVDQSKTVAGDMSRLGASQAAKVFNASVPFSAAMVQSWNALGSAAVAGRTSAEKMASFGKFVAGVSALIGVPTAAEMAYNAILSAEGEIFTDEQGKDWTYDDYYWNGYTTQQRTDNMIVFVPGKPPWEAILMPISPEFGLFRGAVMDGMDAIFNLSQVGAISEADPEQTKVSRDQFLSSLARVLDIPIPPLVAAAWSASGLDVRLGLSIEESNDPDDPGAGLSLIRNFPLGQGERVTRRTGRAKFAASSMDTDTVAILQDLFGSGGSMYVAIHEAFNAGRNLKGGSVAEGIGDAALAFADGARKQARWTQPLFGKTLRPNANDEIARGLANRRTALDRLSKDFNAYFGGGQADAQGRPIVGNTVVPPDDPINFELAADAKNVLKMIRVLDADIAKLRADISTMGNATNLGSFAERNSAIDAKTLTIQSLKAKQLGSIIDYETRATDILSQRYGRDVNINLATFAPRANLRESSISKELLKKPQTSQ